MKFLVIVHSVLYTDINPPPHPPPPPLSACYSSTLTSGRRGAARRGGAVHRGGCCCCWNKMAVRAGGAAEVSWGNAEEEEEGGEEFTPVCLVLPKEQQLRGETEEGFWNDASLFPFPIRVTVWVVLFCNQETNGLTKQITEHSVEDSRGRSRRFQRCPCSVWEVREEIKEVLKPYVFDVMCWGFTRSRFNCTSVGQRQSLRAISSVEKCVCSPSSGGFVLNSH